MDESGFSGRLVSSKRVIMPKGARHAYQSQVSLSGHTTVVQAISASRRTVPPMVIFSGCMPRGDFKAGIPDDWVFKSTDSGFVNTEMLFSGSWRYSFQQLDRRGPYSSSWTFCHAIGTLPSMTSHKKTKLIFFSSLHTHHICSNLWTLCFPPPEV